MGSSSSSSRFGGSPASQNSDDDMIWESGSTSDNPFASAFGGLGSGMAQQQPFFSSGSAQQRKRPGSSGSTSSSWGTPRGPQQHQQQQVELKLSLEELYRGVTKKLKVSRQVFDAATGRAGQQAGQEVLEVQVKPGWKEGE
jgi:DnaJ family protein B protein 4